MLKRMFDILGSVLGLVILAVPLAVLALLVRLNLGAPVLFVQERPGLRGRIFRIYKFRTMADKREPQRNSPARFGPSDADSAAGCAPPAWMNCRNFSTCCAGEMSFVGPRPLLVEYLPLYSPEQARRHEVRPGITGWSQVNGRNAVDWDQRLGHGRLVRGQPVPVAGFAYPVDDRVQSGPAGGHQPGRAGHHGTFSWFGPLNPLWGRQSRPPGIILSSRMNRVLQQGTSDRWK